MADTPAPLRLLAQDPEDLPVISAALQDAVAKVGDILWESKPARLTVAFNRFRWEGGDVVPPQRVRSALQIGGVLEVKSRRIRRDRKDAIIELLALTFEPGEAPGGAIVLGFAGGGDLRVQVECIDAVLADLTDAWPARRTPRHDTEAA